MSIAICAITKDVLAQMQDVLTCSAGYEVSLDDELEYFNPLASVGWLAAKSSAGKFLGFVRYFMQNAQWSHAEFYVDPAIDERKAVALQLLTEFKAQAKFDAGHRVRFDVARQDAVLHSALEELGFSTQKQLFHRFELSLVDRVKAPQASPLPGPANAKEIAEVLSNLHPVNEGEVLKWLSEGSIRIHSIENRIASAAHLCVHGASAEIVRIATHVDLTRRGSATKLLNQICQELAAQGIKLLYLKVESVRLPAIAFYKKFGFKENEFKSQTWHSRCF